MSIWAQGLINLINQKVRNYPLESFQDMNMNSILIQIVQQIDNVIGGGPISEANCLSVTQANFTTTKDCPLTALNGFSLAIFMQDVGNFLVKGRDWQDYPGGGFTMLIPGFDATANNYQFYVYTLAN